MICRRHWSPDDGGNIWDEVEELAIGVDSGVWVLVGVTTDGAIAVLADGSFEDEDR